MIKKTVLTAFVLLFAVTSLYPLIWVLMQSLKSDAEFFANQFAPPTDFLWNNYSKAWTEENFDLYYKNTLIVTLFGVALGVLVCVLAGYAFARYRFYGKKLLTLSFVGVLFVPIPVLLLPVYFINRDLDLLNTYAGMIGPYICGIVPLGVLLMRGAFASLPGEIAESARMDGSGEWRTFGQIMLPLTTPTIATVCILQFITVWTDYMWPLIANTNPDMYTLTIGITTMAAQKFVLGYGPVFAGMVISFSFIILVYVFLQKYFMRALSDGAVKG
ncbi:carbohydrate ABC transporter permease [Cohnella cellulosilytica]|uniref:Carbohydrate ABC transporter permease n=1 Tax=Cohnella cellulosilytica TaxID=986710 RepID=A0ABW2FRD3_9BACL